MEAEALPRPLLDLSQAAVNAHWSRQGVAALIRTMERCEPWVIESQPEFRLRAEKCVEQLCDALNQGTGAGIAGSVDRDAAAVLDFMCYLKTGRALLLFAWLAQVHPEIPRALINSATATGSDSGVVLIERVGTLERQNLLSRVFSPERIALVLELIEEHGPSRAKG